MSVQTAIPYLGELIAGRYCLESVIGQGGMGLVYAAHDEVLDRPVAIKVAWSNPALAKDQEALARFHREARVASALHHPGAIAIYDVGFCDGRLFLAMERLVGTTLAERIREQPPASVAEIAQIGIRLADVLEAAQAIPIVHRDLKPDNIYFDRSMGEERVVVLDFGLAFKPGGGDAASGRLTQNNITLGTPWYMSPEQIRDRELGTSSDIYALGCVLFEMCTGKPPFHDLSPAKVITDHLLEPVPSLGDIRPDLPDALGDLLTSMLAKEPDQRPTATAVRDRLLELVSVPAVALAAAL